MNALEVLQNIDSISSLRNANLKFCLVSSNKHPLKLDGTNAKPNNVQDFVDFETLKSCQNLSDYSGIGISIQASKVTAIDVDKCFSKPFEIESADERAIDVINTFMDVAYIEFSFSGLGLRVLYRQPEIEDYSRTYYTKNEQYGIEYYQPSNSFRYVTITGKAIVKKDINSKETFSETILNFLNKYMKRKVYVHRESQTIIDDNRSIHDLLTDVMKLYIKNIVFADKWFNKEHKFANIPGKSHESQDDYGLMTALYDNITHDKEKLRIIFEQSPYFKTKDKKHLDKWFKNDYRYYNFIFDEMLRKKGVK